MRLKDFIKTTHFKERQKTRLVSDLTLKKILAEGQYEETETGSRISYKEYLVHLDKSGEILITIIQKDERSISPKILNQSQAQRIKSEILKKLAEDSLNKEEDDPFVDFIKKNKIRKI